MAGKRGYEAARRMRERAPEQRGGNEPHQEHFVRDGKALADHVDGYLDYMRMLNRTRSAVAGDWNSLKYFMRWAHEREITHPEHVTFAVLQNYQRWLWRYRKTNGKPLSVSSQRSRLGAVKTFFSWLCKQHIIAANPASDLDLPRAEKRLPEEALSIAQIEAVLCVPDVHDHLGLRDRAMLELFYSTGIRRTEMARLELADLNREKRILWIRYGKGNKDRVVPVGARALRWVEKYIENVRPLLVVDPAQQTLFLTGYGQAFNHEALGNKVRYIMSKADTGRAHGGCHLLRHTCATHMHEGGADIRFIQELLGHEHLNTTAVYTKVSIEKLQEVHTNTHPAESRNRTKPAPQNDAEAPENPSF